MNPSAVLCRLNVPAQLSHCVCASASAGADKKEIENAKSDNKLGSVQCCDAGHGPLLRREGRSDPANGFTATTLATGKFGEIDVFNHFLPLGSPPQKIWLSWQKTKGDSDLYVQSNTWQPGGSTGWHSHPGHSLIIVTAGTLTEYHGDDPHCKPIVYTQGMTFVDPGGSHVHIIRNEGNAVATNIAVQLIPTGQLRRVDVAARGTARSK